MSNRVQCLVLWSVGDVVHCAVPTHNAVVVECNFPNPELSFAGFNLNTYLVKGSYQRLVDFE
jgi:hypothetical protein